METNKTYFLDQNLLRLSISDESGIGNYDIANFECLEIEDEGIEKEIISKLNSHDELVKALQDLTKYVDNLLIAPDYEIGMNVNHKAKSTYLFNDVKYYQNIAKEALKKVADTPISKI